MAEKKTYQISFSGIVQGVGFRPFIYNLAKSQQLTGFVCNGLKGVQINITAEKQAAEFFLNEILKNMPQKAQVLEQKMEEVAYEFFENFEIRESDSTGQTDLILTPDYAICDECKEELNDPTNHRFEYPFITCTNCGPRFSITKSLPFDRQNTAMAAFKMCDDCKAEYENPTDRRFHSQTNSCPKCGISISIFDDKQQLVSNSQSECIDLIIRYLRDGLILSVKGIGGYLLVVDATNSQAVATLRQRKHRPSKPFAVMCADLKMVRENAFISDVETVSIQADVAPIVLLNQRPNSVISKVVNPELQKIGVMLAYSPLLLLICQKLNKPIVATSGNISGNPIIYDNTKALADFEGIADYVVTNNRDIVIPQDDSVIQFTKKHQQRIILRRSRGFELGQQVNDRKLPKSLAFGASMKSTFALTSQQNLYVSQYLGDLESFETQQNFVKTLEHFQRLFQISEFDIISDAHKGYFSSELANETAEKKGGGVTKIQHHLAHLAAVLAENQLDDTNTLGVVWDGTGHGTDGNIWGGEFFDLRDNSRIHFEYFDAILGDKMPREPRISVFSLAKNQLNSEPILKQKFTENEWILYQKVINKNTLKTSSVGRIFDAVASLLKLIDVQSYEGQAAILLEQLAQKYFDENGYDFNESYFDLTKIQTEVPLNQMVSKILEDLVAQKSREYVSAKFHFSLVKIVEKIASQKSIKNIAFSGGVFQNALLIDLLIHHLEPNFNLYFHKNLPPNDENISFGQIIYHQTSLKNL